MRPDQQKPITGAQARPQKIQLPQAKTLQDASEELPLGNSNNQIAAQLATDLKESSVQLSYPVHWIYSPVKILDTPAPE